MNRDDSVASTAMTLNPMDLIGNAKAREMCGGITRATLIRWRAEYEFPAPLEAPDLEHEVWDRADVERWLSENREFIKASKQLRAKQKRGNKRR